MASDGSSWISATIMRRERRSPRFSRFFPTVSFATRRKTSKHETARVITSGANARASVVRAAGFGENLSSLPSPGRRGASPCRESPTPPRRLSRSTSRPPTTGPAALRAGSRRRRGGPHHHDEVLAHHPRVRRLHIQRSARHRARRRQGQADVWRDLDGGKAAPDGADPDGAQREVRSRGARRALRELRHLVRASARHLHREGRASGVRAPRGEAARGLLRARHRTPAP